MRAPVLEELLPDFFAGVCLLLALDCDANKVGTSIHTLLNLLHSGVHIPGVCTPEIAPREIACL